MSGINRENNAQINCICFFWEVHVYQRLVSRGLEFVMSLQGLAKLSGQAADKDILTVEYFILGEELILYKKEGREETMEWNR